MNENELSLNTSQDIGEVKISADVITVIAHTVASEVEGVSSMSSGIADNISSVLGRKTSSKGVKVDITDKELSSISISWWIMEPESQMWPGGSRNVSSLQLKACPACMSMPLTSMYKV